MSLPRLFVQDGFADSSHAASPDAESIADGPLSQDPQATPMNPVSQTNDDTTPVTDIELVPKELELIVPQYNARDMAFEDASLGLPEESPDTCPEEVYIPGFPYMAPSQFADIPSFMPLPASPLAPSLVPEPALAAEAHVRHEWLAGQLLQEVTPVAEVTSDLRDEADMFLLTDDSESVSGMSADTEGLPAPSPLEPVTHGSQAEDIQMSDVSPDAPAPQVMGRDGAVPDYEALTAEHTFDRLDVDFSGPRYVTDGLPMNMRVLAVV